MGGNQPLPLLIVTTGNPQRPRFLVVVSQNGPSSKAAISPIEIVGEFRSSGIEPDQSPEAFIGNQEFSNFLHATIAQHGPSLPALIQAAKHQEEGWLYIMDGRTPTPQDDVPMRDIIGAFEVRAGSILQDSYWRNVDHLLYTEHGFFQLEAGLRERVLGQLTISAGSPA